MFFPIVAVSVDTDTLRLHLEDVLWAAEKCGVASVEKLAVVLEIDAMQLRRQMQGEGHFSLTRLIAAMPPQFWGYLGWRLICRFDLPEEAKKAAEIQRAVNGRKKMLRMGEVEAKRRTA
jgi:hypothetical protein